MRVPEETIQPAPDSVNGSGRRFIEGFTRVEDELFILRCQSLLEPDNEQCIKRYSIEKNK